MFYFRDITQEPGFGGMREVKWNRQVREERDKTVGIDRDNGWFCPVPAGHWLVSGGCML